MSDYHDIQPAILLERFGTVRGEVVQPSNSAEQLMAQLPEATTDRTPLPEDGRSTAARLIDGDLTSVSEATHE